MIVVDLLDKCGHVCARWRFRNAWPSKFRVAPVSVGGNTAAVELVTIEHEGFKRDADVATPAIGGERVGTRRLARAKWEHEKWRPRIAETVLTENSSARMDGENLHRGTGTYFVLVGTTIDACPFRTRPQAAASPAAYRLPCPPSRNPWPSLPSENNRVPARLRSSAAAGQYASCRSR